MAFCEGFLFTGEFYSDFKMDENKKSFREFNLPKLLLKRHSLNS
jgi:hypothetical protein